MLKPRARKVKILATLGPASSDPDMIRALVEAGADAFRINMSHGSQAEKAKLVEAIRGLEKTLHRPMTIVFDLQGPKLRVGKFKGGSAQLTSGHMFVLDRDKEPGDATLDQERARRGLWRVEDHRCDESRQVARAVQQFGDGREQGANRGGLPQEIDVVPERPEDPRPLRLAAARGCPVFVRVRGAPEVSAARAVPRAP